jgi:hypothetical protein
MWLLASNEMLGGVSRVKGEDDGMKGVCEEGFGVFRFFGGSTGVDVWVDTDFGKDAGVAGGVVLLIESRSSNFSKFASTSFHIATPSSILRRYI